VTALKGRQAVLARRGQENVEEPAGEGQQTRNNQRQHDDRTKPQLSSVAQKDKEFSEKRHFSSASCGSGPTPICTFRGAARLESASASEASASEASASEASTSEASPERQGRERRGQRHP
jgi:hypothetical protein